MSAYSSQSFGLGSFVVGGIVIILVVAGGLSGLSKNLFESTSTAELNAERAGRIHDQGVKLGSVRRDLIRQKKLLVEQERLVRPVQEAKKLTTELEVFKDELADLQLEASQRGDEIAELEEEKARYRARVRGRIWPRYLNQEFKAEHLAKPMTYRKPRITKIDPTGVMVMHSGGSDRVQVSDLSEEFKILLDLDPVEANKLMTELWIKDAQVKKQRGRRADQAGQPTAAEVEAALATKLLEGMAKVDKYVDLIRYAEETARVARHNDRYSSNRSVPGKLETWAERTRKFESAAAKYLKELSATVDEVREIDPNFKYPKF